MYKSCSPVMHQLKVCTAGTLGIYSVEVLYGQYYGSQIIYTLVLASILSVTSLKLLLVGHPNGIPFVVKCIKVMLDLNNIFYTLIAGYCIIGMCT